MWQPLIISAEILCPDEITFRVPSGCGLQGPYCLSTEALPGSAKGDPAAMAAHRETGCPVPASWAGFVACSWVNEGGTAPSCGLSRLARICAGLLSLCLGNPGPRPAVSGSGPGASQMETEGSCRQEEGLKLYMTPCAIY